MINKLSYGLEKVFKVKIFFPQQSTYFLPSQSLEDKSMAKVFTTSFHKVNWNPGMKSITDNLVLLIDFLLIS